MWPLMARNLIGTMLLCGLWDWILYFSPLKDRLHDFKVNYSLIWLLSLIIVLLFLKCFLTEIFFEKN